MVVLWILLGLLFVAFWATVGVLFYMAIVRFDSVRRRRKDASMPPAKPFADQIRAGAAWFRAQNLEKVYLTSYDGLKLVGNYLHHPQAKGTILLMHGFRSNGFHDFGAAYEFYYSLGYSLLSVFQRAHGESEGKFICFGVKERFDCQSWANYVCRRMGPEHPIFLAGVSMGASTVLMATGLPLPPAVRGVIADCGYTSAWEEFKTVLKVGMHLPVHPLLEATNLVCRVVAGFGFRDCSTLDAMKVNRLPVLFVHGQADKLVPHRHSLDNFAACQAEKRLVSIPDAGHGVSYLVDTPQYQQAVRQFLQAHT